MSVLLTSCSTELGRGNAAYFCSAVSKLLVASIRVKKIQLVIVK